MVVNFFMTPVLVIFGKFLSCLKCMDLYEPVKQFLA